MVDSSAGAEAVATAKVAEAVLNAHAVQRAAGFPASFPTFIGSDNLANAMVAGGQGLATNLRHCLRRYHVVRQRVDRGEIEIGHVPDVENNTDFLTKWVSKAKYDKSVAYACNTRNAPTAASEARDG